MDSASRLPHSIRRLCLCLCVPAKAFLAGSKPQPNLVDAVSLFRYVYSNCSLKPRVPCFDPAPRCLQGIFPTPNKPVRKHMSILNVCLWSRNSCYNRRQLSLDRFEDGRVREGRLLLKTEVRKREGDPPERGHYGLGYCRGGSKSAAEVDSRYGC